MAAEWYVSDAAPVHCVDIVRRAAALAPALGCAGFDLAAGIRDAGRRAFLERDGEFDDELAAYGGGDPVLVVLTASRMVGDDGREVPQKLIFGSVSAGPDRLSATLALILALSWLDVAGGALWGTGLARRWSRRELDTLVRAFAPAPGTPFDAAVRHVAGLALGRT